MAALWPAVNCARQRVNGTQMHLIKPEYADSELKHRYMKIIAVQFEILNCSASMRENCHWITICSELRTRLSSEADVEQIFSFSGRVATAERITMSSSLLEAMTTVKSLYPYFKPSGSEIFGEYHKTRDDFCNNDDLEANED